ncbi:MAG TPA: bifunctional YncE family protein/alkaline phosphatase family protein [Gemmatimonadaceae bacterium]|nr:bifunctional YncE family protein/alkaline phosphatase family protein [Gemmatimonadaceae bacterium]
MIATLLPFVFAAFQQTGAQQPRRAVPDPGVIATDQRVTPAGVQTVFTGRVAGVRFGATANQLWVAVPRAAYLLDWRDNRVLSVARFDGTPGVHGVAVDPVTHHVLVSSVGRLPAGMEQSRTPGVGQLSRGRAVAQLTGFAASAGGAQSDSAVAVLHAGPLGAFMAGGVAVARRANASGHRVAVVPLPANDQVAIIDADAGTVLRTLDVGVLPVAAAVSADGSTAWITNFGGPKPASNDRASRQCCDPMAEPVRVDARGIAEPGTVQQIDLVTGRLATSVVVGRHPTGIAWDEARGLLYVADGNSDAVTTVDTRRGTVLRTMGIAPFDETKIGLAPTAVALSPDGATLFVALGGVNAVAEYDVAAPSGRGAIGFKGLIPTGWYPSSLDVSADGTTLAVGTLLGVGSGTGTTGGSPGKVGRYVHAVRGSVNVISVPSAAELAAYTTAVARNNRLTLASEHVKVAVDADAAPRAVPMRPGDRSLIDHVVFIVRENRTYDQVLGDIGRGASDSSLVIYGKDVTPNAHALANQFVLLDHFFASGGNSADGHQWLTQANETDYPMWPLYQGRSYPYNGVDALTYSLGGFLWEDAADHGRTVSVFGEYAPAPSDSISAVRREYLAAYRDRATHDAAYFAGLLARRYDTHSDIPSLDRALVRGYPGWTQEVPDVVKADAFDAQVRGWTSSGAMPNLVMLILPNDHTNGTSPGWSTPRASVADNDWALGKMVQTLSHSPFWKSMAILVVEDDAQDGVDHIDGHRTVALAISPYARRGVIDSTFYSQPSMVKTVELMLGLPALSIFDLVAKDMRASFIEPGAAPDLAPYTALEPRQSIYDVNPRLGMLHGPARAGALASSRMRLDMPDAAPSDELNRILWHDARGWNTPYPAVRQSLFFPMSVNIPDDEREERGGGADRGPRPGPQRDR